jgi:hypothetical protein
MKKWLKYLLLFWVLMFSTGIAMAQGPYEFTGSQTGQEWVNQNGTGGATAALNYTYITIPLNQGNSLEHLDYSISWKNHGWGSSSSSSNAKINLYNNNNFVITLETIYENNSANANTYYTYTGSLSFNTSISSGYNIKVEINAPNWGGNTWESYINSASITAVTGPSCETLIFENDFESSLNTTVWSTTSGVLPLLFPYNSTSVFGPFGSKTINLDLSGLPTHTFIRVEFDLYIFDSWDGNNANDEWKLKVDGVDRMHTDFDNHTWYSTPGNVQSYPHNVEFSNPVLTGAVLTGLPSRCWNSSNSGPQGSSTSLYFINNITQHTGTSLTIGLQGLGLQGICDESWGIDNVKVYALGIVDGCTDPTACNYDPLAICDDGSCLGLLGCMDNTACNYNVLATCDDGSCILPDGCTDNTACNYNPLATCDDGSCVYDVSIVTATNVCTGVCDGEVNVAISPITPGTNYTYTIDGGSVIPYSTNTNGLCVGNHSYEFFIDGISCGVTSIIVGEYPAMTLQTTAVDSTCDSSYAFVSASLASSSTGNISTLTYCTSSPAQFAYSNIEFVSLVGDGNSIVNNTSGVCDDYTDYTTTHYTTLTGGQSYSVDVNLGYCNFAFMDSVKVFIDWNIDGDFNDIGEEVGVFGGISPSFNTFLFTVPNNGSYGVTRMRVVSQAQSPNPAFTSGPVGACDVGDFGTNGTYDQPWYGATEDYSIVISTPTTLTNATYQWSNGDTDSITNSLAAGTYTVIVTDDNGCEANDTVSVGQSFQVQLDSLIAAPNPACFGDTVTLAAYPSSPQYEYKFMYNAGAGWNNITITGWDINNPVIYNNITQQTQFRVKVRSSIDNSCTTAWKTITVPVIIIPTSGPIWHN